MLVRPIEHKDVEQVVALSELCYDEMQFDDYGYRFDKAHITQGFHEAVAQEKHICLIAEDKDTILGIIFFSLATQTMYFKNRLIATEIVWHSLPSGSQILRTKVMDKLLKTSLYFLQEKGVKVLFCSSDARFTVPKQILDKNGFKTLSIYAVKEL